MPPEERWARGALGVVVRPLRGLWQVPELREPRGVSPAAISGLSERAGTERVWLGGAAGWAGRLAWLGCGPGPQASLGAVGNSSSTATTSYTSYTSYTSITPSTTTPVTPAAETPLLPSLRAA